MGNSLILNDFFISSQTRSAAATSGKAQGLQLAERELGNEVKKIAAEITEKSRASTAVDWQVRESVRAKLRILVRRRLQKWKYPPDRQPNAVELVLKQAEELSNNWPM